MHVHTGILAVVGSVSMTLALVLAWCLAGVRSSRLVSMLWHPRMHADPVHAWLRDCVRKTAADPKHRS